MIFNRQAIIAGIECLRRFGGFTGHVLKTFLRNHGILLAGGVGYNVLLSMVPLFALLCVSLTHIFDEQQLLAIIAVQAAHLTPTHADLVVDTVEELMDSREMVGWVGILALLFFSSFAFRMLEDSIAIVFHQAEPRSRRNFWISAALPYLFMIVLGSSLLVLMLGIALTSGLYDLLSSRLGFRLAVGEISEVALHLISFLGMACLFSAIYKILPVVKIATRRALIGGLVAAILWEGVRLFVMFYINNISFVNTIYGSLAAIIILLLTLEVGAFILLLGAQVIAELERNAKEGLPWYYAPPR